MGPVQITPKASRDIAKLAQGVDRAQVALDTLRESNLSSDQVKQLQALLTTVSSTEGAASATKSKAVAEFMLVDGHAAVVGKITVNGEQLDTLLSEGSFNKSHSDQRSYATKLGYGIATRAENRAYVDSLLAKEEDHSINGPEANALETYRDRYVRDCRGALNVDGRRVIGHTDDRWEDDDGSPAPAYNTLGMLYVRASAASK